MIEKGRHAARVTRKGEVAECTGCIAGRECMAVTVASVSAGWTGSYLDGMLAVDVTLDRADLGRVDGYREDLSSIEQYRLLVSASDLCIAGLVERCASPQQPSTES